MSWSAIIAGFVTAMAVWGLLYMLGLGTGLAAIDEDDARPFRELGLNLGIWSLIAPIVSLFIGGMVVGRIVGPMTRGVGALYGAIVWAAATMAVLAIVWSTATAILGATGAQPSPAPQMDEAQFSVAASDAGKGIIALVVALALSLGTSIAGATLSVRREQKRAARLTPAASH